MSYLQELPFDEVQKFNEITSERHLRIDVIHTHKIVNHKSVSLSKINNDRIYAPIKIGWLLDEAKLSYLFNKLHNAAKTNSDFNNFKSHFIGNEQALHKIKWLAPFHELTYLMLQLMSKQITPYRKEYLILIQNHFSNKKDENVNINSLRVMKSRSLKGDTEMFYDKVISELLCSKSL